MKPSCYFRKSALRQGDTGHEVWALQLCLNGLGYYTSISGVFDSATDKGVVDFQRAEKLTVDGLAGQVTQRRLFIRTARPVEAALKIPLGIARGVAEGESGFYCGMVDCSTPGGKDCGWVGTRVYEGQYETSTAWLNAYDGKIAVTNALGAIREAKDEFYGRPGALTDEAAWKIAIGSRNWPAAALQIAAGRIDTWQYRERLADGRVVYRSMNDEAEWVKRIGVYGVKTGKQWWNHYVSTKVGYVKYWTP